MNVMNQHPKSAEPVGEDKSVARFFRQSGLLATDRLRATQATVIGVGAIGRQVAMQLASLGVGGLTLIDFDSVEEHNITSQGYRQADLGRAKVEALAEAIQGIDPAIKLALVPDRFRPSEQISPVVFCGVDSISARAAIWRAVEPRGEFWCDGRMLGEVIRVLSVSDRDSARHYASTLFQQAEAQVGSCTSRSTIYAASIAAGLMIHQFSRWLRELSVDRDLQLNLLSSELSVDLPVAGG